MEREGEGKKKTWYKLTATKHLKVTLFYSKQPSCKRIYHPKKKIAYIWRKSVFYLLYFSTDLHLEEKKIDAAKYSLRCVFMLVMSVSDGANHI